MSVKAGFDPSQVRDPHTGEWIDVPGLSDLDFAFGDFEPRMSQEVPASVVDAGVKPMDGEWANSARAYTRGGYKSVNAKLRAGEDPAEDSMSAEGRITRHLRGLMGDVDPVTVWRGIRMGPGPPLGMASDEEVFDEYADFAEGHFHVGDEVELGGFQSTSFAIEPAIDAASSRTTPGLVFEIFARRGVYLGEITDFDDESEFVLPDDARFRVRRVLRRVEFHDPIGEGSAYRTVIQLEQL